MEKFTITIPVFAFLLLSINNNNDDDNNNNNNNNNNINSVYKWYYKEIMVI